MTNKIIEGIAINLKRDFKKTIYCEEIKQGFCKPCFFIKALKPEFQQGFRDRTKVINPFVIQYFPDGKGRNRDMNDIAFRLSEALKFIELDGHIIRGVDMSHEKSGGVLVSGLNTVYENVDGILNFYVSYNFHIKSERKNELMKKLFSSK